MSHKDAISTSPLGQEVEIWYYKTLNGTKKEVGGNYMNETRWSLTMVVWNCLADVTQLEIKVRPAHLSEKIDTPDSPPPGHIRIGWK